MVPISPYVRRIAPLVVLLGATWVVIGYSISWHWYQRPWRIPFEDIHGHASSREFVWHNVCSIDDSKAGIWIGTSFNADKVVDKSEPEFGLLSLL